MGGRVATISIQNSKRIIGEKINFQNIETDFNV